MNKRAKYKNLYELRARQAALNAEQSMLGKKIIAESKVALITLPVFPYLHVLWKHQCAWKGFFLPVASCRESNLVLKIKLYGQDHYGDDRKTDRQAHWAESSHVVNPHSRTASAKQQT